MGGKRDRLTVLPGGKEPSARALESLSDEALLAIIATPDGELALAELYDRYGKIAYGLAYRVLRDSSLAEDAVQEAFLTVWRTAGTYIRERGKPRTWLLTLVHRRAVDLVRREQRRRMPAACRGAAAGHAGGGGGGGAPRPPPRRAGGADSSCRPTSARRSSSRTTAA